MEMKKVILVSNDGIVEAIEMTFEEVFEKFEKLIFSEIGRTQRKMGYQIDPDEFKQIANIEFWKAFEQYDAEKGYCFTTYVHTKLRKASRDVIQPFFSKKGVSQRNSISVEKFSSPSIEEESTLSKEVSRQMVIDGGRTSEDNMIGSELEYLVFSSLKSNEIELMQIILDVKEYSVTEYAERHSISRQAANKRVIKLKTKLQDIIKESYEGAY